MIAVLNPCLFCGLGTRGKAIVLVLICATGANRPSCRPSADQIHDYAYFDDEGRSFLKLKILEEAREMAQTCVLLYRRTTYASARYLSTLAGGTVRCWFVDRELPTRVTSRR